MATKSYKILNALTVDENGVTVEPYAQIKSALIDDYRSIYGNDIEISSPSADGQYISMEAVLLQNIYEAIDTLASNLSATTASGRSLDVMASIASIHRKPATRSTAQVWVYYTGNGTKSPSSLVLVDKNGNEWKWWNKKHTGTNTYYTTFEKGSLPSVLEFTCISKNGAVAAEGLRTYNDTTYDSFDELSADVVKDEEATSFWVSDFFKNNRGCIYQTIENGDYLVYQFSDASVGSNRESDSELRNRIQTKQNSNSSTIVETLETNLTNIEGVDDCIILNNVNYSEGWELDDYRESGATIPYHNVYVVVKYAENVNEDNLKPRIAETIYTTLTPGCSTFLEGEQKSDEEGTHLVSTNCGERICQNLSLRSTTSMTEEPNTVDVHWTAASCVDIQIFMSCTVLNADGFNSETQREALTSALTSYINGLSFGDTIQGAQIMSIALANDLKSGGTSSFVPTGIVIADNGMTYDLLLQYAHVSSIKIPTDVSNGDTVEITITLE